MSRRISVRRALPVSSFFLALLLAPAPVGAQDAARPDRERRIEEVLRRIEELKRSVEELRREGARAGGRAVAAEASATVARAVLPEEWVKGLDWRSIGPAGMGGRITDLSVFEEDPTTWWIATASGGLLKTANNGVTFEHQFDREATVSIGAVCVAPSNRDVVWVGTGEANPRNSVSYGDGVYKSTDGGKTWTNMGLRESYQIGRIVVHPKDPDVVYVGALGRLYGPNEERGLFKTTDGGKTWKKIHYVDAKTGVIEIAMHPADPETLIVATWERRRNEYDSHPGEPELPDGYNTYDPIEKWGPGSGLFKTTDGGKTFRRLAKGLPTSNLGRMDIEYWRKDPSVLFALVDCEKIGMGRPPSRVYLGVQGEDAEGGARITRVTEKTPAARAGLQAGDLVESIGGKPVAGYGELVRGLRDHDAGERLAFEIVRGAEKKRIEVVLENRPLGAGLTSGGVWAGFQGENAEEGARLTQVTDEGPAAKAGLRVGDIVRAVNRGSVMTWEDLTEALRGHEVGERIQLEVRREDKTEEIPLVLEERPTGRFGRGGGFGLMALLGAATEDEEGGLRLTRVQDKRAAKKAGLEEGDLLREFEGAPIRDAAELLERLGERHEGDKVAFKVERESETREVVVTLEPPGGLNITRPWEYSYVGQQANVQDRQGPDAHEYGGVYKSTDGGESWTRVNSLHSRPMYFGQIRVDPSDDQFVYVLGVALHRSKDGGKTFTADGGRSVHSDYHALWIDPNDGRHMIVGTDGGFYATWDRATHWEHLNTTNIGQFYHVAVDTREPYWVYGGLQDNGSWGGPSRTLRSQGALNEDWINVGGGDGFVCRIDPFDPDIVYAESQNGVMVRRNLRTGERASIRPRPPRGVRYRFNWNTPFILSNHNPGIFYAAGNFVFRSVKRGDDLRAISPEITRTGHGSGTALAESPLNPDLLWAGTDDGNLWVTRDGGVNWKNVAEKVGLPGPRWVATVEPSRFIEGRCYVAFDAHRSDDDDRYLFVTEDFGETWTSIRANLPWGSTRCLREDARNPELLYCGTEFAAWASLDRGGSWTRINNDLPTVAIHEIAVHPTAGEIVAATHGRSLWVLDVTPLRQMSAETIAAAAHLYEPNAVVRWRTEPSKGTGGGSQRFTGENPSRSAQICYSLASKADKVAIAVLDHSGETVRELTAKAEPGFHMVSWDLRRAPTRAAPGSERGTTRPARAVPASGARGRAVPAGFAGARGGFGGGQTVEPGLYRVVLTVDGREFTQTLRIDPDPSLPREILPDGEEGSEDGAPAPAAWSDG